MDGLILRQAQDEVDVSKLPSLALSLSSRQRRPEAAKGEGGLRYMFSDPKAYSPIDIQRLAWTFWMLSSQPCSLSDTRLTEP